MIQRKLSNGMWTDVKDVDSYIDMALKRDSWFAPRINREPMTTRQQVLDFLATGQTIRYGDDHYESLRDGTVHEQRVEAARQKQQQDPRRYPNGRVLDCGHTVYHQDHVMSASNGTSCTDCYE